MSQQHTKHGTRSKACSAAARVGTWIAAGVAVLAIAVGASSTLVGAVSTDNSTVRGNEFAKALRVDAGVYELVARPDSGAMFGPGPATGNVSLAMQPTAAKPLELHAGQELAVIVELPEGVRPLDLPAPDAGDGFSRSWAAEETGGIWAVRTAVVATADTQVSLPPATFAIETDISDVRAAEGLRLTAGIELPDGLASTHPTDSVVLPVAWNVQTGVYDLAFDRSTSNGLVRFTSHPTGADETLHLVAGDVLSTAVMLPSGVTPGVMPAASNTEGLSTSWTKARAGTEWVVTQTITVTDPVMQYRAQAGSFPVSVGAAPGSNGFSMRADVTLPERFVSSHPSMETRVSGRIPVPRLSRVAAGGGQSLAITERERLAFGWGDSEYGQVGNGSTSFVMSPAVLGKSQHFAQVSAGANHSLGIGDDHNIYGWGDDGFSQVGATSTTNKITTPTRITPTVPSEFTQVSAGQYHSLALASDGQAYGWGFRLGGALGPGSIEELIFTPTPLGQPAGVEFVQLEAGNQTTFGLASDGTVWGMGSNAEGALGLGRDTGEVTELTEFTQIPMPEGAQIVQLATSISATGQHTLALTSTGEIIAWGNNRGGQAGATQEGQAPTILWEPTKIQLPAGVAFKRVAAGQQFSLAISSDGRVFSWGDTALGYASSGKTTVPKAVALPYASGGYVDIAAGDEHAFALSSDSRLYGWGSGRGGRLGNKSEAMQITPVPVPLTLTRDGDERAAAAEPVEGNADAEGQESNGEVQPNEPDAQPNGPGDDEEPPVTEDTELDAVEAPENGGEDAAMAREPDAGALVRRPHTELVASAS